MVLLLSLAVLCCLIFAVAYAAVWGVQAIARDYTDARKWRALVAEAEALKAAQPSTPVGGFTVVYKVKKQTHTAHVPGATEAEALRNLTKLSIPFDKVVSLTPN